MDDIMEAHIWELQVRDYELDSHGIVNNAVYLNYFEESRSHCAIHLGLDLREYAKLGYNFLLASTKIEYKRPLLCQELFYVITAIVKVTKQRIYFQQEIKRKRDNKLIATALAEVACVAQKTGRACMPAELTALMQMI